MILIKKYLKKIIQQKIKNHRIMSNRKYFLNLKMIFFVTFIFFLNSCEDLFLRFKYETYQCQENNMDLRKVSIKDNKVGDFVDVEIGNYLYKFKIIEVNDKDMIIEEETEDFSIKINHNTNNIEAKLNNLIFKVSCDKKTFKM